MSEINFKNGSKIEVLSPDSANQNVRGNRSKIIGSQCYDTETGQWVFREWNIDEPFDRYIPEFIFLDWKMNNKEDEEIKTSNFTITERQVEIMQHAIGYRIDRVKRGTYIVFRNYYAASSFDINWEDLVGKGLAKRDDNDTQYIYYFVTREGMDLIERITGVQIKEDK